VSSPQQVLPGAHGSPAKRRASAKDLFAALFLLAFLGVGLVVTIRGLATDRMQQTETPDYVAPPFHVFYDPADTRKLIGEIAGCVLTLLVSAVGCWRLRRRPAEPRLERLLAAPRVGETRDKWIAAPAPRAGEGAARPARPQPVRRATTASVAAERLSVVVWTDHLARQEGERA
jgi:hypothetical protein